jgi:hypothetical protein
MELSVMWLRENVLVKNGGEIPTLTSRRVWGQLANLSATLSSFLFLIDKRCLFKEF